MYYIFVEDMDGKVACVGSKSSYVAADDLGNKYNGAVYIEEGNGYTEARQKMQARRASKHGIGAGYQNVRRY